MFGYRGTSVDTNLPSPLGSLTRNSSVNLKDFKSLSEKKKIYDAISAASIFHNVAGEATSRYAELGHFNINTIGVLDIKLQSVPITDV